MDNQKDNILQIRIYQCWFWRILDKLMAGRPRKIKTDLAQRLLDLRKQSGKSIGEASEACGVSVSALANYERGDNVPDAEFIRKFVKLTGSDAWQLLSGEDPMQSYQLSVGEGIQMVPRFDVQASAGTGALVPSEDVSEHFAVGRDWLRRNLPAWAPANATVGVLDGSGDSMEPTIRDGDTLIIVRDVELRIVERGGIFVFSLDDRLLLKRLQVMDNGDLRIISDNKAYEAFTILFRDIPERIIIHGQVFFAGGKPRSLNGL